MIFEYKDYVWIKKIPIKFLLGIFSLNEKESDLEQWRFLIVYFLLSNTRETFTLKKLLNWAEKTLNDDVSENELEHVLEKLLEKDWIKKETPTKWTINKYPIWLKKLNFT